MEMDRTIRANKGNLRRATERLLAWGFEPRAIAEQLGCSLSSVYAVQRRRAAAQSDVDERTMRALELLRGL